jgi:glycine cleavage system H protein
MKDLKEFQDGELWMMEDGESFLIGVTQSALDAAGALSELDASEAGDEFEAGDWIGEIRGKNQTLDITAPFDLRVVEKNEEVIRQPSLVEDDPTGDAWVLRVERKTDDEQEE